MLKNYFKIAFRNLFRNKLYSLINIAGLTLGIACSTLLAFYVVDELSYETMHGQRDQIYRIIITDLSAEEPRKYGSTAGMMGPELVENFSEITNSARMWQTTGQITFIHEGARYGEREWIFADRNFFQFFDFELLSGDQNTALNEPNSIILTESAARKFFGSTDALGKMVRENRMGELQVTGVIRDFPSNSHLQLEMILSQPEIDENWEAYFADFSRLGTFTYLMLDKDTDTKALETRFPDFLRQKIGEDSEQVSMSLQSLNDIRFGSSDIEFGTDTAKGEIKYVYIFISIAIFVLLIAAINYINLSTARAMQRAREIGVRKASGAQRRQLVAQFLSESTVISMLSFVLAIGIVDLALPFFENLTQKTALGGSFINTIGIQFIITVFIGLASGVYPALYLSRIQPTSILQNKITGGKSGELFRRVLVITQFSLSIFMIIATAVVYNQLNYIGNRDLGFDKEQMVVVDINHGNVRSKFESMKSEFLKSPYVQQVSATSRVPGEWKNISEMYAKVSERPSDSTLTYYMGFDADAIPTFGFDLVLGENFSGNHSSDSTKIILNETAVRALGLPENPLGSTVRLMRRPEIEFTVIGVVRDFHFQSLHTDIAPLVIGYWNAPIRVIDYFTIKVTGDMKAAIADLTAVHNMFDDGTPIEYHFLDSQIDRFYENEKRAGNIFLFGAMLIIFIACFGLFGLASFMIQKRTKEIGIRKVLGASNSGLYLLISTSFIKQVLVAWVIASPVAYIVMKKWLSLFTYHAPLSPLVIGAAGLIAIVVALITVSYRSISASMANPASTLKYD